MGVKETGNADKWIHAYMYTQNKSIIAMAFTLEHALKMLTNQEERIQSSDAIKKK